MKEKNKLVLAARCVAPRGTPVWEGAGAPSGPGAGASGCLRARTGPACRPAPASAPGLRRPGYAGYAGLRRRPGDLARGRGKKKEGHGKGGACGGNWGGRRRRNDKSRRAGASTQGAAHRVVHHIRCTYSLPQKASPTKITKNSLRERNFSQCVRRWVHRAALSAGSAGGPLGCAALRGNAGRASRPTKPSRTSRTCRLALVWTHPQLLLLLAATVGRAGAGRERRPVAFVFSSRAAAVAAAQQPWPGNEPILPVK